MFFLPAIRCPIYRMMMRLVGIPSLVLWSLTATAGAQTTAPSATPTNGAVGSAALINGYPGSGGAFTLPAIANSNTAATPLAGTTTFSTTSTSTTATTSTGSVSSSGTSNTRMGGAGRSGTSRGGGGASTAGAATATGSTGSGPHWVLCPPNGAPGIEPLFAGTDLSCAPQ